jgi:phage baseplate assembly protein W
MAQNYTDINSKINQDNVQDSIAVKNSIKNILSTRIGSVPGHPEFGCGLTKYLFEPLDPFTSQMMKEEISYALERWETRIIIKEIQVTEDYDYNRLDVSLTYFIKSAQGIEQEYIMNFIR